MRLAIDAVYEQVHDNEQAIEHAAFLLNWITVEAPQNRLEGWMEQYPLLQTLFFIIRLGLPVSIVAVHAVSSVFRNASLGACVREEGRLQPAKSEVRDFFLHVDMVAGSLNLAEGHHFAKALPNMIWFYFSLGFSDRAVDPEDPTSMLLTRESAGARGWDFIVALRVISMLTGVASVPRLKVRGKTWLQVDLWRRFWTYYFQQQPSLTME
jgi:hypothetical protein